MTEKHVLVFRKKLLPFSETFISDQGRSFEKYRSLYAGFQYDASGFFMLSDEDCCLLESYSNNVSLSKFFYRLGLANKMWMDRMNEFQCEVIHAHFLDDGLDALLLKEKMKIPLIVTLHGHDITKKEKSKFLKKSRKDFFSHVDKVIAVSDHIYQCALKNGCPEEKLIKHYIGIDLKKFSRDKHEVDTPEILFVGRLVEKKGCIYLLQAMKQLKSKQPDAKLLIIGEGPLGSDLKKYAKEHDLNVDFLGRKTPEEVSKYLSNAWVFVAPSITAQDGDAEGLGMVFLEAQALQTPVVTFKSGGVPEAIEDGVTGFLEEEKNVDGLVNKISYFIDNPQERIAFGKRGRSRVEKKFNVRKQCLLLEDIYDSIL